MELIRPVERELIILEEMQRRVLLKAAPAAQKRVKQAKINLEKAKENLKEAERGLEEAHKMAERTTLPILRKKIEYTRKRALALSKREHKSIGAAKFLEAQFEKWI
ncbi:MAG: hypothetical protein KGI25_04950 [Thaumarchaeota archaeon]|nr:hypothetical protein [Nitrososphaerota archaeon]